MVFTKEKFWIQKNGNNWDLYIYVPLMYCYYHIFRGSTRKEILEYMDRKHLTGSIREAA